VPRRTLCLFVAAAALFYFSSLGTIPLLEPDEGRYAEIPREMLASGDFVTPHLNGVVYLEKPPLYYWGTAAGLALFGENEFGARAFAAAVCVAGIVLTYWMGAALAGPRTGLYAAIVLSTSAYYYVIGRLNTLDMTLAVFLVAAIFPAYLYLSGRRSSRAYLLVSYGAAALAYLTKGLVGIVFPAAILLGWFALSRRHREIGRAFSLAGALLFLVLALPWTVLVQARNPDFFRFFFVHEHLLRYTTGVHHREGPFWYFLPVVAAAFFPWVAFLRRAALAVRGAAGDFFEREDRLFLAVWVLFVLGFFSFSHSKLVTYAAPLVPPAAVLFGRALDLWAAREDGAVRCRFPLALALFTAFALLWAPSFFRGRPPAQARWVAEVALPCLLVLLWGAIPLFVKRLGADRVILLSFLVLSLFFTSLNRPAAALLGERKSVKSMAAVLAASLRPGDAVAQYGTYRQGIPFYARCRTIQVNDAGELAFGAEHAADRARWFLEEEEFLRLWNSGTRVFCVLKREAMPLVREKLARHRLLYRSEAGILVVNRF